MSWKNTCSAPSPGRFNRLFRLLVPTVLKPHIIPNIGNGLHFFVPSVTIVLFLITDERDVTDPLLHSEERRSDHEEPEEALSGCSPRRTPPREESSP